MTSADPTTPAGYFAGCPLGLAALGRVEEVLSTAGLPHTVRTSRSQVALRRRRGFAFLWRPGQYLSRPTSEVVLSIALDHHLPSSRFKEVAHPTPTVWMHHLELITVDDVDDEVAAWLCEAAEQAG